MEFEKEALFKQLVSNSGMNLYLGAGFSAYAYNSDKESLPLGNMLLFYFHEDIDDYKDLLYALNKMTKIIVQYEEVIEEIEDQDYLIMRSKLFAERSLKLIDKITMGKVLKEFWNRINPHIIYRYDVMKRRAYDADIITNVYNVKDGQDFYEKMFLINKSPFVKHQYAIFLLRKKQFDLAWKQIDQAYTESEKKVFTIANTHAVIMFEMNIGAEANSDNGRRGNTLSNKWNCHF